MKAECYQVININRMNNRIIQSASLTSYYTEYVLPIIRDFGANHNSVSQFGNIIKWHITKYF